MGDNPLGNIPLGVSQPDADKAGGGPPRTSLVTNIIDGAQKDFAETLQKNLDKSKKSKETKMASRKAGKEVASLTGKILKAYGIDSDDEELDPKDYKLEADEINELFRATSGQRGGLTLQLCIFFSVVLFILVDTVSISAMQGSARAFHYLTEERYWKYLNGLKNSDEEQVINELILSSSPNVSQEDKEALHAFYQDADIEFRDPKDVQMEEFYVFGLERAGRVLRFIKRPEDFMKWLRFILMNIWGPKDYLDDIHGDFDEIFGLTEKYNQETMCPDLSEQPLLTYERSGLYMMDSAYVMGARLVVTNAEKKEIIGNSPFKAIYNETRSYLPSYVTRDISDHTDTAAFTEHVDNSDDLNHIDDHEFVKFFNGGMSCEEIEKLYKYVLDENIISDKLLQMDFEIMSYSADSRQGSLLRYRFFQSHAGILFAYLSKNPFQPENNGVPTEETWIRVVLQSIFLFCMLWIMIESIIGLRLKCRQLCTYRLNEFSLHDFVQYILLFLGTVILVQGGTLFWSPGYSYGDNFQLPVPDYEYYKKWVEVAELQESFRAMLGSFIMMQMINLLLTASVILPSLGILFRTIERSMADMFVFTMITLLIYIVFVITVYISFGEQVYQFSSLTESFLSCFEMFMGDIYYTRMYKADQQVSAIVLIMFVLVMNFMVLNMYTAIVIRTYNKLQARQLFLGQSMAQIQAKKAKKKITNCLNLLRCRSTFSQNRDDVARRIDPEDEDKGANQKLSQIFSQNLSRVMRNKVMTKDKFTRELERAAQQVAKDKQRQTKERNRQIKNANVKESYSKLQSACAMLLHLIVAFMFYYFWSEAEVHADIRGAVLKYIEEVPSVTGGEMDLSELQATYIEPLTTVRNFNLTSIGMNHVVQDTMRITIRLYKLQENSNNNTAEIFPQIKTSKHDFESVAGKARPFMKRLSKGALVMLSSVAEEQKDVFSHANEDGVFQVDYTGGGGGSFDTFYDEGGFVFLFDTSAKKIYKPTVGTEKELNILDFGLETVNNDLRQDLGLLNFDWAMYNPNQDVFIYVGIQFSYTTGGDVKPNVKVQTFRASPTDIQLVLLAFYSLFYLFYLVKLLIELYNSYEDRKKHRDQLNGVMANPRLNEENERPWYIRLMNFIGIDDQRLQGQNLLVILVLVIYMVLKKIITTVWYLILAIYFYCTARLMNFIEFMNTVLLTMILVSFFNFLPILLSEDDLSSSNDRLLQTINEVAYHQDATHTWKAYSVFCLSVRVLTLPSFSLIANMPFETLNQGSKDIINILIILLIFLFSSSIACYIVFCSELLEFSSIVTSIYNTNKIYMGDFSLIGKMFAVSPLYTFFYLFMSMTLYTFFITQMFLGVVVGHFQDEWKRVQQIVSQSHESYNLIPVIWRVITDYFVYRRDEEERKIARGERSEKGCSCSSFNPITWIERMILFCMLKCCKKKKQGKDDKNKKLLGRQYDEDSELNEYQNDDDSDNDRAAPVDIKKPQAGASELGKARLPFNKDEHQWGMPTLLKSSEDFFQNTGARTYLNWFDGWSIEQYGADWDKMEYNNVSKTQKKKFGGDDLDRKLPDDEMREMRDRLPLGLDYILNLDTIWNDDVDEYEKANSNYWMFHLTKQVNMLTKKEISLYGLKAMDCFFTQHLVSRAPEQSTSLQDQLTKEQVTIFFMKTHERDAFFGDPDKSVDEKYLAWKAIDLVHRYNMQQEAFDDAGDEKEEHTEKGDQDAKPVHTNLMTLLIAQIERPIEEEMEENLFDFSIVNKIAQPKNGKNPLKFEAIKASTWRRKKYHRVFYYLQKVWRELLSNREKYELWFNYFNTMERVRLWNQLVFTREWFRRVVQFSRKQTSYKRAVAKVEDIQKKAARNAAKQKNNKDAAKDEEGSDDENQQAQNQKEKFYRGFHRRDLNDMLKAYARKMYKKGVRSEDLLIIKIKPDQDKEIVERQEIGGTTSFFNNDKKGSDKYKADTIAQLIALDGEDEMKETRKIFTPDQMLKIWNQFLSGTFMLLPEKKQVKDMDEEDGIYSENKILKLEDEDKYQELRDKTKMKEEEFKQYWQDYNSFKNDRTMDRYEQIHFFFSSIVEHNIKTLESCEAALRAKKEAPVDEQQDPNQPKSILKNADQPNQEEKKSKDTSKKAEESKNTATQPQEGLDETQQAKFDLYDSVRNLVIEEEERLPLWMLMSKEEKLDMLAHECIDSEAQIMGLMIEFEYGAENNFKKEGTNLSLDTLLNNALNQMIFQKYLSYTRLQATFYAREFTQKLIDKTQDQSIKLYSYAEYLHDLNKTLRTKERNNTKQIQANRKENEKIEEKLRDIAQTCMDKFKGLKEDQKDRAALAMKFLFEVKDS